MFKKFLAPAVLVTGLTLTPNSAEAAPFQVDGINCLDTNQYPQARGPINDYAGLLDDDSKNQMTVKINALERKTHDEVAILTIKSLQGQTVEDYSKCLGSYWGLGKKGQNNGVLFLVASDDRKTRIQTGRGAMEKLTDGEATDIIQQEVLPYFKQNQYQNGVTHGTDKIIAELDGSKDQLEQQKNAEFNDQALNILTLLGEIAAAAGALYLAYKSQRRYNNIQDQKTTLQNLVNQFPQTQNKVTKIKLSQPRVAWQQIVDDWQQVKENSPDNFSTGKLFFSPDLYSDLAGQVNHTEHVLKKIQVFLPELQACLTEVKQVFASLEKEFAAFKVAIAEQPFTEHVTKVVPIIDFHLSNIREALAKPSDQTAWNAFSFKEVKPAHEAMLKLEKQLNEELKILKLTPAQLRQYHLDIAEQLEQQIAKAKRNRPSSVAALESLQTQLNAQSSDPGDQTAMIYYYYYLTDISTSAGTVPTDSPSSHYHSSGSSYDSSSYSGGGGSFGGGDMGGGGGASGSW